MEDSLKKPSDDLSSLTEQVIFKGGISSNNINNNVDNIFSTLNNDNNKLYSIEKKHDDLLSFRKGEKKYGNDIEALCEKVSNVLKNHEIEPKNKEEEKKTDFKKMFMKTTEKELEIFESERLMKKNSFENEFKENQELNDLEKESNNEKKNA